MSTRLAVVSGAGRGFGQALTIALADDSWDVVALCRSPATNLPDRVEQLTYDVTEAVPDSLLDTIGERPLDLLVNNAGIGAAGHTIATVDPAAMATAFAVNVLGPLRLTQALLPALRQAKTPTVVNVSTRLASLNAQAAGAYAHFDTSYAYRVTKAAQNMLTIGMANELKGEVRCWALHPGSLTTPMGRVDATTTPETAASRLLQRLADPDPASPRFVALDAPDLAW